MEIFSTHINLPKKKILFPIPPHQRLRNFNRLETPKYVNIYPTKLCRCLYRCARQSLNDPNHAICNTVVNNSIQLMKTWYHMEAKEKPFECEGYMTRVLKERFFFIDNNRAECKYIVGL